MNKHKASVIKNHSYLSYWPNGPKKGLTTTLADALQAKRKRERPPSFGVSSSIYSDVIHNYNNSHRRMRKGKFVIQHSKKLTLQKVQKEALERKENMVSDPVFINQPPLYQDPSKPQLSRNRSVSKLKVTDHSSTRRSSL